MTNANRQYEGLDANERCKLYSNVLNKALEILVSYTEREVDDILVKRLMADCGRGRFGSDYRIPYFQQRRHGLRRKIPLGQGHRRNGPN